MNRGVARQRAIHTYLFGGIVWNNCQVWVREVRWCWASCYNLTVHRRYEIVASNYTLNLHWTRIELTLKLHGNRIELTWNLHWNRIELTLKLHGNRIELTSNLHWNRIEITSNLHYKRRRIKWLNEWLRVEVRVSDAKLGGVRGFGGVGRCPWYGGVRGGELTYICIYLYIHEYIHIYMRTCAM